MSCDLPIILKGCSLIRLWCNFVLRLQKADGQETVSALVHCLPFGWFEFQAFGIGVGVSGRHGVLVEWDSIHVLQRNAIHVIRLFSSPPLLFLTK